MSATLRGLGLCVDDLSATWSTTFAPNINPGTIVEDDTGHKYIFVYNTGSTSITQYYPAFHASTGTSGWVANTGFTGATKCIAGICMTAIGSSEYGWACIRGFVTAYCTAAVGTVGWGMVGGTIALATATATGDVIVGQAIVTNTQAGTCIIKMLIG